MSTYTPVVVTEGNLETGINENIRLIVEALKTKMTNEGFNIMRANLDMGANRVTNVGEPSTPHSAVRLIDIPA